MIWYGRGATLIDTDHQYRYHTGVLPRQFDRLTDLDGYLYAAFMPPSKVLPVYLSLLNSPVQPHQFLNDLTAFEFKCPAPTSPASALLSSSTVLFQSAAGTVTRPTDHLSNASHALQGTVIIRSHICFLALAGGERPSVSPYPALFPAKCEPHPSEKKQAPRQPPLLPQYLSSVHPHFE